MCPRGQRDGRERVTCQSVREFGDYIGGRRRDEEEVSAIGEFDVAGPPIFLFIEETRRDWILGKSLKRERRDELDRIARHHHENVVPLFDEQTG